MFNYVTVITSSSMDTNLTIINVVKFGSLTNYCRMPNGYLSYIRGSLAVGYESMALRCYRGDVGIVSFIHSLIHS